jgi:predicted glycoside hydrolase/deacetylase ChbG (UPF0249 family)
VKYLVVNGDDFGACAGINRGIVEAHRWGILTSASLMVWMPGAEQAARLAAGCPALSVGLHVCLPEPVLHSAEACRRILDDQLARFCALMGRLPTHVDSHHHVHMRPELMPEFERVAAGNGILLRDCSGVRYCSRFYGQWGGESHPEQVSVGGLLRILESEIVDGITELGCHPGYRDSRLQSSYEAEREMELRTLRNPSVRDFLDQRGIVLVGFEETARLLGSPA